MPSMLRRKPDDIHIFCFVPRLPDAGSLPGSLRLLTYSGWILIFMYAASFDDPSRAGNEVSVISASRNSCSNVFLRLKFAWLTVPLRRLYFLFHEPWIQRRMSSAPEMPKSIVNGSMSTTEVCLTRSFWGPTGSSISWAFANPPSTDFRYAVEA